MLKCDNYKQQYDLSQINIFCTTVFDDVKNMTTNVHHSFLYRDWPLHTCRLTLHDGDGTHLNCIYQVVYYKSNTPT